MNKSIIITTLCDKKEIADKIPNSVLEIVNKENHGSYIIHSEKIYYRRLNIKNM